MPAPQLSAPILRTGCLIADVIAFEAEKPPNNATANHRRAGRHRSAGRSSGFTKLIAMHAVIARSRLFLNASPLDCSLSARSWLLR